MIGVTVSGNMENTHSHIACITAGLKQFKIAILHVSERFTLVHDGTNLCQHRFSCSIVFAPEWYKVRNDHEVQSPMVIIPCSATYSFCHDKIHFSNETSHTFMISHNFVFRPCVCIV